MLNHMILTLIKQIHELIKGMFVKKGNTPQSQFQ